MNKIGAENRIIGPFDLDEPMRTGKPGGSTLVDAVPATEGAKPGGATLTEGSASAPVEVTITYGPKADPAMVSPSAEQVIKELVAKAGDHSCLITSTARSPEDQARVMYNNLESYGVAAQKALYAAAGDQVIDVYSASKQANKTPVQIKADMTAKINELGPSNVSHHCADPASLCVVDIDPGSLAHGAAFVQAVKADGRVSKLIEPPDDPAYHLELPQ